MGGLERGYEWVCISGGDAADWVRPQREAVGGRRPTCRLRWESLQRPYRRLLTAVFFISWPESCSNYPAPIVDDKGEKWAPEHRRPIALSASYEKLHRWPVWERERGCSRCWIFGTSCEFSGQLGLIHFTLWEVHEIPARQQAWCWPQQLAVDPLIQSVIWRQRIFFN